MTSINNAAIGAMSTQDVNTSPVESLPLPEDCGNHIKDLQPVVQGRAEKGNRPALVSLSRISPVYGCDKLAADCIRDASLNSSVAMSPNVEEYTWGIIIFFRGSPTVGKTVTVTLMIPIVTLGPLTIRISGATGETQILQQIGFYHLFRNLTILHIEGDGRMVALCITPIGESV